MHHPRVALVKKTKRSTIAGLRRAHQFLIGTIARNLRIHSRAIRERELQIERRRHEFAIALRFAFLLIDVNPAAAVNNTPKLPICSNLPERGSYFTVLV